MHSINFIFNDRNVQNDFSVSDWNITNLIQFVENKFEIKNPILSYKDSDGDMIRIADNKDCEIFIKNNKEYTIHVKGIKKKIFKKKNLLQKKFHRESTTPKSK